MDPAAVLIMTSAILMFLTLISISYKTGFVSFSIWSLTRKDQPKFEIDKSKAGGFVFMAVAAFMLNVVYSIIILGSAREMGAVLLLSLFNTAVIGYGLSFWVLLKEKHKNSK